MMNSSWRWKFWTAAICTVYAILCVFPNFVAEDSHAWYAKFLPNSKVQLGLDLQGGIQMTLGVDLNRALMNEADRHVRDLEEFLKKDNISFLKIERDFSDTDIHVHLSPETDMSKFETFVHTKFNVLEITSSDSKNHEYVLNIPTDRQSELERLTIQQALEVLRTRLDEFGVAEPSIQAKGKDNIVIQLPGLADPTRAREILAQTAQLEFKLVDDRSMNQLELQKLVDGALKEMPPKFTPEEFNFKIKDKLPAGTEVLFEEKTDPTTKEVHRTPYLLILGERISGDLLDDARIGSGEFGQPNVSVHFNPEGTRQFDELTKKNINHRLAIILDGQVKSAPVLQSHISDGRAQITLGSYRPRDELFREATDLALVLRAGALPAPIEILSTQAVGPSLGKDSIQKGLDAMMWGLIVIILFMAMYYRFSGVVADFVLVINVIFTVACLGLLHATLTLPGIAGILVSVGMSVDANIIILERIRDELRWGKTVKAAISNGYDRVQLTILDSHITTIITGLVLFEFGTGSIKGFAITLIFGLIANYFTALWFTKIFYDWFLMKFEPETISI
jgi:protein-export membrane protein SecD